MEFIRSAKSPLRRPASAVVTRSLMLRRHHPQLEGTWRSQGARARPETTQGSYRRRDSRSMSRSALMGSVSARIKEAIADDEEDEMAVSMYVLAARRQKAATRVHAWVRRVVARRKWRRVTKRRFELIVRPVVRAWSQLTFMRKFLLGWRARKVFARWKFFYLERKAAYRIVLNISRSEALDRARESRWTSAHA